MAISLTHAFTNPKADGGDTTIVRPSDWNAEHTLSMATARLIGRTSASAGAAEEISVSADLSLSAGVLGVASTIYKSGGTDVALADGGTGASLTDPGADRVLFWDDSAGATTWLTMGTNLTITTTTLDATGSVERLALSPSANQNDYATGASTSLQIHSIVDLTPSASIKITGISSTSMATGKRLTLRNAGDANSASSYLIILDRASASSSASNRIDWANPIPLIIIPGDEVTLQFDGTDWEVIGGNKPFGRVNAWDMVFPINTSVSTWSNGTGAGTSAGATVPSSSGGPVGARLQTGSTSTGVTCTSPNNTHQFVQPWFPGRASSGAFAVFVRGGPSVNLSTGTEEFRIFTGLTSGDSPSYGGTDMDDPARVIAFVYDRAALGTTWYQMTRSSAGNQTTNDTSVTVAVV